MSSDMSQEIVGVFAKISASCDQLADAVEDENKKAAMRALVKCAMANIHLCRLKGIEQFGIEPVFQKDEEEEFKSKLLDLLAQ